MQGARTRPRRNAELTDVIVCAGGEDDRVVLRCMEAFSPADGQWASLGNLPYAVRMYFPRPPPRPALQLLFPVRFRPHVHSPVQGVLTVGAMTLASLSL